MQTLTHQALVSTATVEHYLSELAKWQAQSAQYQEATEQRLSTIEQQLQHVADELKQSRDRETQLRQEFLVQQKAHEPKSKNAADATGKPGELVPVYATFHTLHKLKTYLKVGDFVSRNFAICIAVNNNFGKHFYVIAPVSGIVKYLHEDVILGGCILGQRVKIAEIEKVEVL
ncbi:MAG: hypothetical protein ACMV0H_00065 [Aquaspirillum sp.]